jgi:hypothetical protein
VRHEDARRAVLRRGRHEARREGDDPLEKVAVGDPQRQRVRRAVREPAGDDPLRVHRHAPEDVGQRAVDRPHVAPEAAQDHVPGAPRDLDGEQHESQVVHEAVQRIEAVLRGAAAPVQRQHERRGRLGAVAGGHVQQRLRPGERKALEPRLDGAGRRPRPRRDPSVLPAAR